MLNTPSSAAAYACLVLLSAGNLVAGLMGLGVLTHDGQTSRSQAEQQRLSNREACRDEWLALMRSTMHRSTDPFVSGSGQACASGPSPGTTNGGNLLPRTPNGHSAATGGQDEATFVALRMGAQALLQHLRPDNLSAFAELFTAAVLQAAATGEALLDESLSHLASKDVARFHQLNQRMQVDPKKPLTPTTPGSRHGKHPGNYASNGSGTPHARTPKGGNGSTQRAALAAKVAAEFPAELQGFVQFLEAADSFSVNVHLSRHMTGQLLRMVADCTADAGRGVVPPVDRIISMSTLALFLSYLSFVPAASLAAASVDKPGSDQAPAARSSFPLDLATVLTSSMQQKNGANAKDAAMLTAPALLWTLPWVVRCLWFCHWDAASAAAMKTIAGLLSDIHRCPALQPSNAFFCLGSLLLTCLLDGMRERQGAWLRSPSKAEASALAQVASLASAGKQSCWNDPRYIHLCCPSLRHAHAVLQSSAAASALPGPGLRKINPTAPLQPAVQVPACLLKAADGTTDTVQLQLQCRFLEMYSTSEDKVRLKDLLEYVTATITSAVGPSCMDLALKTAVDAALSQFDVAVRTALKNGSFPLDGSANDESADRMNQHKGVDAEALHLQLAPLKQQLIESATQEAYCYLYTCIHLARWAARASDSSQRFLAWSLLQ
ncbi:hypothetical protein WJX73_000982 [Symbiochloris irregularis]|uniref:Uncharacterized protein n=1 Tax=Symbiochloris irregularis TaxID=706552 RepID=A0AAW1PRI5_9CHLO